jgi:hypothetical protein
MHYVRMAETDASVTVHCGGQIDNLNATLKNVGVSVLTAQNVYVGLLCGADSADGHRRLFGADAGRDLWTGGVCRAVRHRCGCRARR